MFVVYTQEKTEIGNVLKMLHMFVVYTHVRLIVHNIF